MIKIVAVAQIENRRLGFDEEGVPQVFAKGDLVLDERDTEGTSVKAPGLA